MFRTVGEGTHPFVVLAGGDPVATTRSDWLDGNPFPPSGAGRDSLPQYRYQEDTMAEPIDDLQTKLNRLLAEEQTKTILALMDSVTQSARFAERVGEMILTLTNEVSLIEARVSMLEADGDTPFPPNGDPS